MPSMATIEDIEDAITQLKETGIYHVKNGDIGTAILGMEETGSQFSISEGGLTFYKRNVFANDIIRAILAKTLKQSYLGFYTKLKEDPGHIILLRKGGQSPDILCVLLWNKGSRVTYYPGSHLKPLDSYRGANRIWEVTSASLDNAGCQPQYIDFDDGGWCIIDARLAFERRESVIVCAFATRDVVQKWPKLVPAASITQTQLASLVPEVISENVGIHLDIGYVDTASNSK